MRRRQQTNKIATAVLIALLLVALLPFSAFAAQSLDLPIPVTSLVQGDAPGTDEIFTFSISAITAGAPMPTANTITISGNGTKNFTIHYTHAGVYEYEITEIAGSTSGYTYDSTIYRVTVTVTNTDTGELSAKLTIQTSEGIEKYTQVLFSNTYLSPVVPPPPGTDPTGSLTISKTVTGALGHPTASFHFTITLKDKNEIELTDAYPYAGTNVPGGSIHSGDAVTLSNGQSINIKDLPVGTTYTVVEAEADADGYTTIVQGATGTITALGNASRWENYRPGLPGVDPDPAVVILDPQKTLNGVAPQGSQFSFYLKDENGHVIETVHNDGGDIPFSPITLTQAGTYVYYMTEAATGPSNITYDGSAYKVTVTVARVGDELVSDIAILRNGEPYDGTVPLFENKTIPGGGDHNTEKTITIYKNWTGDADAMEYRPNSITVTVSQEGHADKELTLTETNGWQASINVYSSGAITVTEKTPDGYVSSVSGNMTSGFIVTNTFMGKEPPITPPEPYNPNPSPDPTPTPVPTPTPTPDSGSDVPKTGDDTNLPGLFVGLVLCVLLIVAALIGLNQTKKRYRK